MGAKGSDGMEWISLVQRALNYMEDHLLEEMNAEIVARELFVSGAYFQKMFRIATGMTVGDYLRNRRLSLAGEELAGGKLRVMEAAFRYGYESPESFAKAFLRFHGIPPSAVRKSSCRLNYFAPLKIQVQIQGGFIMSRKLIPNVEKLYETRSENYMFPSCMRSAMTALNEDEGFDFSFFAGITGDLFTQVWLEPKWMYCDSYSNVCRDTREPIRAAFDACGYEYTYVSREELLRRRTEYLGRIVESVDRGLPVLAFGIVGPPVCSIICGYAEAGEVLIGWSQFTGNKTDDPVMDHEFSENYFQVRDGLERSEALVFFGRKKERPSIAESLRTSVLRLPKLAALPEAGGVFFGRQAFSRWADSLLQDELFREEGMLEGPLDTYRSCVVQTGTNLFYVDSVLERTLRLCPELEPRLQKLRELFQLEKEAFDQLIDFQGGYFLERDPGALLSSGFRAALSRHVNRVGQLYGEAALSLVGTCE